MAVLHIQLANASFKLNQRDWFQWYGAAYIEEPLIRMSIQKNPRVNTSIQV